MVGDGDGKLVRVRANLGSSSAVQKAMNEARKNMISVRIKGGTFYGVTEENMVPLQF